MTSKEREKELRDMNLHLDLTNTYRDLYSAFHYLLDKRNSLEEDLYGLESYAEERNRGLTKRESLLYDELNDRCGEIEECIESINSAMEKIERYSDWERVQREIDVEDDED